MDAKKQKIYDKYMLTLSIKGLANTTVELYSREAKAFMNFVNDLETLSSPIINKYLMTYSSLSHSSRNAHSSSLRVFLKYLKKNVYHDMNTINIPYIKSGRKLPEILNPNALMKRINLMKDKAENSTHWMHKRNYALVMLLYATGMRISEALSFDRGHINEHNWLRIDEGKGLKDRYVPIARGAIKALDSYMKACPFSLNNAFFVSYYGTALSRTSAYKILKEYMGLSPHSMRHHFATHMIINGADISVVSELLGHSSLTTTQIYTHIQKPQLAVTVNNYHPMHKGVEDAI